MQFKTLIMTTILSVLIIAMPSHAGQWKQKKNSNNIKVWTKDIPGQPLKAMKGETIIQASITDIGYLLQTPSAFPKWVADLESSKLIKQVSKASQLLYFVQKTPVKDRDVVIKGSLSQNPKTKAITVTMVNVPNVVKPNSKYVRIPKMNGKLTFTPAGNGKLKVVYLLTVNPGGNIPKLIANTFAVQTPYKTLLGLKKLSANLTPYRDSKKVKFSN
jgi:hypothetical protein